MGQYFNAVFLNAGGDIVAALHPSDYGAGVKLAGHSRANTPLMRAVHTLLALDGGLHLGLARRLFRTRARPRHQPVPPRAGLPLRAFSRGCLT